MTNVNNTETFEIISEQFNKYLKANQLRKTPERIEILRLIHVQRNYFDAEFLFNQMKEKYRVSLATIYNTLNLLVECQLIAKHQIGNEPAKYEKIYGNGNNHIHWVCIKCGAIKEQKDEYIKRLIKNRSFRGFQAVYHSFYIYGICAKCAKSTNRGKTNK